jgi:hypothetical protein
MVHATHGRIVRLCVAPIEWTTLDRVIESNPTADSLAESAVEK